MTYLPNQYLLSLIFAICLFSASIYSELISYFQKFKYVIFCLALLIGVYNLSVNYGAYKQRSFKLNAINEYLYKCNLRDKTIIGPWAASVTWKSKSFTLPVWDKYFNWEDPINRYKPSVVITETDERESDFCYKNQGIDLYQISDSSKEFDVGDYELVLFFIKN
jgi:hypothetical protein